MKFSDKARKWIKNILKLCVSGFALFFVFSRVNIVNTFNTISDASLSLVFVALAVYTLSQILSAERVRGMLLALPVHIAHRANIKLYWLGMFYNFFLPGGIGGDGYKVFWLHRRFGTEVRPAVMTLLADRISGLVAICIYTVLYASFRPGLMMATGFDAGFSQYWLLSLIPVGLWSCWLFFRLLQRNIANALWLAELRSMLVQGLQMCAASIILLALGLNLSDAIGDYLFLFLLSSVASAVPITIGGIGAREAAFVVGSRYLGTNENLAVSLSMLFYIVSLLSSLPGVFYAVRTDLIDGASMPEPEVTPSFQDAIEAVSDGPASQAEQEFTEASNDK